MVSRLFPVDQVIQQKQQVLLRVLPTVSEVWKVNDVEVRGWGAYRSVQEDRRTYVVVE